MKAMKEAKEALLEGVDSLLAGISECKEEIEEAKNVRELMCARQTLMAVLGCGLTMSNDTNPVCTLVWTNDPMDVQKL